MSTATETVTPIPDPQSSWGRRTNHWYATRVMQWLARAVESGLPMGPALHNLRIEWTIIRSVRAARWRERLGMIAGDLDAGEPLSTALERHIGPFLPVPVTRALKTAEMNRQLRRALPLLAAGMTHSSRTIQHLRATLAYPAVQSAFFVATTGFLSVFVTPKLTYMYHEMLPDELHTASSYRLLTAFTALYPSFFPTLVILGVLTIVGLVLLQHAPVRSLWENLLLRLPVTGTLVQRHTTLQASEALAAFLAAGLDLADAADIAADTVTSPRAGRALQHIAAAVRDGTPWPDAWQHMAIGTPMTDWMVRNAAAREAPQEGMHNVCDWLTYDLNRSYRRIMRWLEPCWVLANGAVIGIFVYAFAGTVFTLTTRALETL